MVVLDHLILEVADADLAADFLCEMVGLERAATRPPFQIVRAGETSIDLLPTRTAIEPRHLAFRIGSEAFDELLARFCACGQPYWSGPFHRHPDGVYRTGDVRPAVIVLRFSLRCHQMSESSPDAVLQQSDSG